MCVCTCVFGRGVVSTRLTGLDGTVALSATPVGSWQLVVGSWQLAVGSLQLGVGSWQLLVGSTQLAVGSS